MALGSADTGTIYVGNGAAPGRRRMAHIKPIDVASGRDAMIQFLRNIQQGSEYKDVIEYLDDPENGNKEAETAEKLRQLLTKEFSGLGLSKKVIQDMLVDAASNAMGTSMMDPVMQQSPSLGTIVADDLRNDIREDGGNKTMLDNLKVVLRAVKMLQEDPSSIGREPSGPQVLMLSSTMSSDEATRRKQRQRGVFKAPGEEKRKSYPANIFSAEEISAATSSDEDGYRLTLLRLRM